ncbi:YozE family protein [Flammeovirga agarivorans]|uniref:YozE SAM-like domain-containing protein n=1 Tax=Flammeovirga agarivorans TaxID=2726742 RepID=A0A7X8SQ82_9BACT|nr:hypothetical protein [Flammeovirga agarivorans]NLR94391.1 hypothetical protein [Flammeovirga agarivorans]
MIEKFRDFIFSISNEDSAQSDLARHIMIDTNFPWDTSIEEIKGYLDFHTSMGGTNDVFQILIKNFAKYLQ